MRRIFLLMCITLAIIGLAGCSTGKDIDAAKALGQNYYDALKAKDFETAMSFYSPQFFEKTSRSDTLQALKGVNAKLGDLLSCDFTYLQVSRYGGTGGYFTRYNLNYDTTYSKGSAEETLTIIKSEDGSKMQILGFNIESLALLTN